ncbi:hypothetical protein B9Z55_004483 [Caenorhabditis nigoni]|uniref:Uncharacterized protein n=1 Tax=Caenorhabditis nigoni TaxID=1611254 RepID=A0A2G5UX10_9PELO|nr:hypothetical protein B9Z55_004483 [Caenorhabditis nigoni]
MCKKTATVSRTGSENRIGKNDEDQSGVESKKQPSEFDDTRAAEEPSVEVNEQSPEKNDEEKQPSVYDNVSPSTTPKAIAKHSAEMKNKGNTEKESGGFENAKSTDETGLEGEKRNMEKESGGFENAKSTDETELKAEKRRQSDNSNAESGINENESPIYVNAEKLTTARREGFLDIPSRTLVEHVIRNLDLQIVIIAHYLNNDMNTIGKDVTSAKERFPLTRKCQTQFEFALCNVFVQTVKDLIKEGHWIAQIERNLNEAESKIFKTIKELHSLTRIWESGEKFLPGNLAFESHCLFELTGKKTKEESNVSRVYYSRVLHAGDELFWKSLYNRYENFLLQQLQKFTHNTHHAKQALLNAHAKKYAFAGITDTGLFMTTKTTHSISTEDYKQLVHVFCTAGNYFK